MNRKKKPKLKRQTRQSPNHPGIKRRKEDGRPRGTLKKFPFEQTRLGFILKYEAPFVYDLIIELAPFNFKTRPTVDHIMRVCNASDDPLLKKPKFGRYLAEYRRLGVYCGRGKKPTPERDAYYERIRKAKLERYVKRNRDEIERFKALLSDQ